MQGKKKENCFRIVIIIAIISSGIIISIIVVIIVILGTNLSLFSMYSRP